MLACRTGRGAWAAPPILSAVAASTAHMAERRRLRPNRQVARAAQTHEAKAVALAEGGLGIFGDRGGDKRRAGEVLLAAGAESLEAAALVRDAVAAHLHVDGAPKAPGELNKLADALVAELGQLEGIAVARSVLTTVIALACEREMGEVPGFINQLDEGKQAGAELINDLLVSADVELADCVPLLKESVKEGITIYLAVQDIASQPQAGDSLREFALTCPNYLEQLVELGASDAGYAKLLSAGIDLAKAMVKPVTFFNSTFQFYSYPDDPLSLSKEVTQQRDILCRAFRKLQEVQAVKQAMGASLSRPAAELMHVLGEELLPHFLAGYESALKPQATMLLTKLISCRVTQQGAEQQKLQQRVDTMEAVGKTALEDIEGLKQQQAQAGQLLQNQAVLSHFQQQNSQALQSKVLELEQELVRQGRQHQQETEYLRQEVTSLKRKRNLEVDFATSPVPFGNSNAFVNPPQQGEESVAKAARGEAGLGIDLDNFVDMMLDENQGVA